MSTQQTVSPCPTHGGGATAANHPVRPMSPRRPGRRTLAVSLAVTALAATVVGSAVGATAASAATLRTRTCTAQPAPCSLTAPFVGGMVGGTVDKQGAELLSVPWTVTYRGITVCRGTYRPADPPKAWSCVVPGSLLVVGTSIAFSTPGLPDTTRLTMLA